MNSRLLVFTICILASVFMYASETIRINFQPRNAPTVPGYLVDAGDVYAYQGNGYAYGWSQNQAPYMHDRNQNSNQLLDTLCAIRANTQWNLAVSPGIYSVFVCVGDSGYRKKHTINVEGVNYWTNIDLVANQFATQTRTVICSDSNLTIDNGASPALDTHINYVEITQQMPPQITYVDQTGPTQATIYWSDNSTVEYALQLWRYSGAEGWRLLVSSPGVTGYVDNEITPGWSYQYLVRAIYNPESSIYNDGVSAYLTADYVPPAPVNFSATPVSSSQINLAWTNAAANAWYFDVYRSSDGANYGLVTTLASNATSYADTGLGTLQTYYYIIRVRSRYNASQTGAIAATTFGPPAAPSNLTGSSTSPGVVVLSWIDNSNNETGFRIEKRTTGGFEFLEDVPAGTTGFAKTALPNGATYTFRVAAFNGAGFSGYTNEVSVTIQGIPVIVNPPVGSPNPSNGTTITLSVLGNDDGGEAALTYTWSTTGTPPAPVIYSVNGTNAAKTTVATVTQPGTYNFQVTIKDAQNFSVTANVSVVVNSALTTITLAPASTVVNPSGTAQFTPTAKNQFGQTISASFTWSATGGTVSTAGLYTAGTTPGTFSVTASSGGKSGTASVRVNAAPTVATAAKATPSPVTGTTTVLSVLGADDGGESALIYTWATTGTPPAAVTFSANGTNAAKSSTATFTKIGSYSFQVTIKDVQNRTVTSAVTVAVNPTLTTVAVTPTPSVINPSATQQFTAAAKDQFGANLVTQPTFTWTATGGTVSTAGLYTADATAGTFAVNAASGGKTGTASVRINAAPTVATAAIATPSPVTGTTTVLSVLGADDGGEPALTYTWATTGTPPAAVTFSANATNAAKSSTATFTKIGSYSFQVTIKDAQNRTVTSAVTVAVNPTLTTVAVTPTPSVINPSATQQFTAAAKDQFGANLVTQPTFTWTATGGTVSTAGLYTAGATPGTFAVNAASGGKTGTASVRINAAPTVATAAKATPSPVTGTTTVLSVLGADDGGESALTYTWATTGTPPATVTFSANGTNAAKSSTATFTKAGSYSFQATITDAQNRTVTSAVTVIVNATLTTVAVSPTPTTVITQLTRQFTATGKDQFGTNLATQPAFTWTVSGGGTINSTGLFTAGANAGGPFTVTATNTGKSGTASITIIANAAPTVATAAKATPSPVTGTTTVLSALGADDAGETNLTYTWATTGTPPAAVTFSANGTNTAKNSTATFTKIGSYTFQVTIRDQQGLTATNSVTVAVNATLTTIAVAPTTTTLQPAATQQFTASGKDQFGATLATQPAFSWTSTGGTISAAGLYTAGGTQGAFTATASSGGKSGSASVTIQTNAPPTIATAASANPSVILDTSTRLEVLGADDGGEASLTYTWETTGSPPAPVVFSSNGANSSKITQAMFTQPGNYTFRVTIRDIQNLSTVSTVSVVVNRALSVVAVTPATVQLNQNAMQQFSVSARDQFGVALTPQPSFTWSVTGGGTVSTGGLFTASTTPGVFEVQVSNGTAIGSATILVRDLQPVAPVAEGGWASVIEDVPGPILLRAYDLNNDPLTYIITKQPDLGTFSGTAPNLTYNPRPQVNGFDTFSFKVSDGTLESEEVLSIIYVMPANDAPNAVGMNVNVQMNVAKQVVLLASDPDGDALSYIISTPPARGLLSGTAPNLIYQPHANFIGTDSFVFSALDGNLSDSALVSITIASTVPVDTTPPVIFVPDVVTSTFDPAGTTVFFPQPVVSDNVTPNPTVTFDPPESFKFPVGTRTVRATARDAANNVAFHDFSVRVVLKRSQPAGITIELKTPLDRYISDNASVRFKGICSITDAPISILGNGEVLATGTASSNGEFDFNGTIPDGKYEIVARVNSTSSKSIELWVDTAAPTELEFDVETDDIPSSMVSPGRFTGTSTDDGTDALGVFNIKFTSNDPSVPASIVQPPNGSSTSWTAGYTFTGIPTVVRDFEFSRPYKTENQPNYRSLDGVENEFSGTYSDAVYWKPIVLSPRANSSITPKKIVVNKNEEILIGIDPDSFEYWEDGWSSQQPNKFVSYQYAVCTQAAGTTYVGQDKLYFKSSSLDLLKLKFTVAGKHEVKFQVFGDVTRFENDQFIVERDKPIKPSPTDVPNPDVVVEVYVLDTELNAYDISGRKLTDQEKVEDGGLFTTFRRDYDVTTDPAASTVRPKLVLKKPSEFPEGANVRLSVQTPGASRGMGNIRLLENTGSGFSVYTGSTIQFSEMETEKEFFIDTNAKSFALRDVQIYADVRAPGVEFETGGPIPVAGVVGASFELLFKGEFQSRLATNNAPGWMPNPTSVAGSNNGWTFVYAGEPIFDRLIRFSNPPAPTIRDGTPPFRPVVITDINLTPGTLTAAQRAQYTGDPIKNSPVNLKQSTLFLGDADPAVPGQLKLVPAGQNNFPPGSEILYDFEFSIGTKYTAKPIALPQGTNSVVVMNHLLLDEALPKDVRTDKIGNEDEEARIARYRFIRTQEIGLNSFKIDKDVRVRNVERATGLIRLQIPFTEPGKNAVSLVTKTVSAPGPGDVILKHLDTQGSVEIEDFIFSGYDGDRLMGFVKGKLK